MIKESSNNIKKLIFEKQTYHKVPYYFFIFEKKIFVMFLIVIYLFMEQRRNEFENFILFSLIAYILFSYFKGKKYLKDFINSEIEKENLYITFLKRIKDYVFKKNIN